MQKTTGERRSGRRDGRRAASTRVKENSTTSDISSWTYSPANGNFLLLWLQCSSSSQFRVKRLPFVICSPGWPQVFPRPHPTLPPSRRTAPSSGKQMSKLLSLSLKSPHEVALLTPPQFSAPMRVHCATPPFRLTPPRGRCGGVEKYMFTARKSQHNTTVNVNRH